LDQIEVNKFKWSPGQVFYAYSQNLFYVLTSTSSGVLTLLPTTDWVARTGRQALYYQYRHNSPLTNRIDPGTSNIIDIYVVTQQYYTAYQNWLRDTTNTVVEPAQPSIAELSTAYQELQDFKMISDNIVLNSVSFKPLFGAKAAAELRATIKVIRAQNSVASVSEIKSSVLAEMNNYFSIDKWDFGDTFYFSELAAYLHRTLGTIISSVVLVPLDPAKSFGDLYEIRSQPNEIFANGATVDNIDVIDALTSSNLRTAPGSGVI
jgi:anion-transporting  ArsA/GET3 family ATPase